MKYSWSGGFNNHGGTKEVIKNKNEQLPWGKGEPEPGESSIAKRTEVLLLMKLVGQQWKEGWQSLFRSMCVKVVVKTK